jgi:hypothetical protein
VTGDDVLDVLRDARDDGDYVLITPDGQIFTGPIVAVAQAGMRLALL